MATWNAGAERLKGYKEQEILGHHFSCLYTPTDQRQGKPEQNLAEALTQGRMEEEGWRRRKDGTNIPVEIALSSVESEDGPLSVAAIRDLSNRKKLEEHVRTVQRLESIGRLASGIAHDFSNFLTVI